MDHSVTQPTHLVPAPRVAEQLGITRRTLSRWLADKSLSFPMAIDINGRLYFEQSLIDAWKLNRVRRVLVKEAA